MLYFRFGRFCTFSLLAYCLQQFARLFTLLFLYQWHQVRWIHDVIFPYYGVCYGHTNIKWLQCLTAMPVVQPPDKMELTYCIVTEPNYRSIISVTVKQHKKLASIFGAVSVSWRPAWNELRSIGGRRWKWYVAHGLASSLHFSLWNLLWCRNPVW